MTVSVVFLSQSHCRLISPHPTVLRGDFGNSGIENLDEHSIPSNSIAQQYDYDSDSDLDDDFPTQPMTPLAWTVSIPRPDECTEAIPSSSVQEIASSPSSPVGRPPRLLSQNLKEKVNFSP